MPWYPKYKRKFRRRRRIYRKRRYYRKKAPSVGRLLRMKGSNNLILKQKKVSNFTVSSLSVLPYIKAVDFKLSDIPQATSFTDIFDMYKINGVSWKLTCVQFATGIVQGNPQLQVVTCHDYDGEAAGGQTWNSLLERPNAKIANLVAGTTRNSTKTYLTPKTSVPVWNGLVNQGYSTPKGKTWIDCGNPDVPHYGVIFGINPYQNTTPGQPGTASTFVFQVEMTYYLTLKNIR